MGQKSTCLICGAPLPPDTSLRRCSKCALSDLPVEEETLAAAAEPAGAPKSHPAAAKSPNYITGKEIARGGMGAVLDTQDTKFDRSVAMKVMLHPRAQASERRRFLLEARVLGQLAHPNIVPVHDLGTDAEGRMYYTMKLVQGVTLHDIIRGLKKGDPKTVERYPLNHLLTLFCKVCDAVAFAHSRGIIHRDLKPQNIMVGEFGEVLVMDWGLAKILSDGETDFGPVWTFPLYNTNATLPPGSQAPDAGSVDETIVSDTPESTVTPAGQRLSFASEEPEDFFLATDERTMEGTVMGTPHYMAPEQAAGRIADMDARSDIFSLGGILYALLTLRPPVEGQTVAELLEKVRSGDISPPTTVSRSPKDKGTASASQAYSLPHVPNGRIPPAVSAVAMKALAVDAEKRYQSVPALAADIQAYQDGFATSAEDASLMTQLLLLIHRHQREFAIASAAIVTVTALAIWFVINLQHSEQRALKGESDARTAEQVATNATATATRALAETSISLADAALREGDGTAMQAALKNIPDNLRDHSWKYLNTRSDTSIARVQTGKHGADAVVSDPTRPGIFAVTELGGPLTVIDVRTDKRLLTFQPGSSSPKKSSSRSLAWSADGSQIAIGRSNGGGILIHDANTGSQLATLGDHASGELHFSPNGRFLLQNHIRGDVLRMWNTMDGKELWVYRPKVGHEVIGAFHPNGRHAVVFNLRNGIELLNIETGSLDRLVRREEAATASMAINPNGETCVIGKPEGAVIAIDLKTGERRFSLHLPSKRPQRLAFTKDGHRLITLCNLPDGRNSLRVWSMETGEPLDTLILGSGTVEMISAHPVSGELFVTGILSRVWDISGPPERWTLGKSWNATLAYCGSDDLIVAPVHDRMSGLVLLAPKAPKTLWRPHRGDYSDISASEDGNLAAFISPNKPTPIELLRNLRAKNGPTISHHPANHVDLGRLSPSGNRIAVVRQGAIRVSDIETDAAPVILEKEGLHRIHALEWTRDGSHLIGLGIAFRDRGQPDSKERVLRWSAWRGELVTSAGHASPMDALAVAPDALQLAEAGMDRMVRIRDA